jgi:hypothetical protein
MPHGSAVLVPVELVAVDGRERLSHNALNAAPTDAKSTV